MILETKTCTNPECGQTFKVWDKEPKEYYFCSESCHAKCEGGKSFWGKEDRRLTALKNVKITDKEKQNG